MKNKTITAAQIREVLVKQQELNKLMEEAGFEVRKGLTIKVEDSLTLTDEVVELLLQDKNAYPIEFKKEEVADVESHMNFTAEGLELGKGVGKMWERGELDVEGKGWSTIEQTADKFKTTVTQIPTVNSDVECHMTFSPEGFELGKAINNDTPLNFIDTEIRFEDNGKKVVYIRGEKLYMSAEEFFNQSPGKPKSKEVKEDKFSNDHEHIVHNRKELTLEDFLSGEKLEEQKQIAEVAVALQNVLKREVSTWVESEGVRYTYKDLNSGSDKTILTITNRDLRK